MTWKEKAKALLLRDCEVDPDSLAPCLERLRAFATRYQPYFKRSEQRELSLVYLRGLLSPLDRKSVEPIAYTTGERPGRLQHFVGVGKWNDDPIRRQMRVHVVEELGHPDGVLIVDPSQFPKKGTHSVGVRRQWCGNRGKTENCQSGATLTSTSKAWPSGSRGSFSATSARASTTGPVVPDDCPRPAFRRPDPQWTGVRRQEPTSASTASRPPA